MNGPRLLMALLMAASIVAPAQQSAEHGLENRCGELPNIVRVKATKAISKT